MWVPEMRGQARGFIIWGLDPRAPLAFVFNLIPDETFESRRSLLLYRHAWTIDLGLWCPHFTASFKITRAEISYIIKPIISGKFRAHESNISSQLKPEEQKL